MVRFLPLGLLVLLFSSCLNEPDCIITSSNEVKITFHKLTSDSARTVILDSIRVTGADSVFNAGDTVTSVKLPVDPRLAEVTFRFYYEAKQDSLVLTYRRETRMISPACGAFNHFLDLSIRVGTFPDAKVVLPELSTSTATNVKIKL